MKKYYYAFLNAKRQGDFQTRRMYKDMWDKGEMKRFYGTLFLELVFRALLASAVFYGIYLVIKEIV